MDKPPKNNVTSITKATKAFGHMSRKPKISGSGPGKRMLGPVDLLSIKAPRKKRRKDVNQKVKPARESKEPKLPSLTGQVVNFPDIPGLDEEKAIIGKGIIDLNKALFEQTIYESERLGKIRNILSKIEITLLDPKEFDKLDPETKLKFFEVLRKDSESTVNFLERMQRNSINVMLVFEIYKKLMETIKGDVEGSGQGLPAGVDKSKVMVLKGALLDILKTGSE